MTIVTLSNYNWFKEWENRPCKRRGDDYDAYKKTLGYKCIDTACDLFPKIKVRKRNYNFYFFHQFFYQDHIDYVNIGSPLSNNFYLGSQKGEIYGLDHTKERFAMANNALLRPETDIEGNFFYI